MGKNDFDLFEEWARGILYRGGKEMDEFLSGYVTGIRLFTALLIILFLIGWFLGD